MLAPSHSVIDGKEVINKLLAKYNMHGTAYSASESRCCRGGSEALPFQLVLILEKSSKGLSTIKFVAGATIDNSYILAELPEVINNHTLELEWDVSALDVFCDCLCDKKLCSKGFALWVWIKLHGHTKS